MIVVEYRLPLPISLNEYNRALRYVVARVAESTTGVNPGEGIEILKNEPFGPGEVAGMPDGGVYTEKVLRFRSRVPAMLRRFMPLSATEIHESSWFSSSKGSRCRTIYRNPFLGDRFYLSIDSNHLEGVDNEENAVSLDEDDLAKRQVFYLDVAGNVPRKLPTEDPSTFISEKTPRGLLQPGWWKLEEGVSDNDDDEEAAETSGSIAFSAAGDESTSPPCASAGCSAGSSSGGVTSEEVESCTKDKDDGKPTEFFKGGGSNPKHTMCCYKVVKMEFTGFGLRRFVQRWATRGLIPNGFIDIHRKLFVWMDDWWDLSIEDLEQIEERTAENVNAQFNDPDVVNQVAKNSAIPEYNEEEVLL